MPIFSAGWVESKDMHNFILYVITSTGIVGAVPFFLGMCFCVAAAWRARSGPYRTLPISMMTCLVVATLSASWLQAKLLWIILAFAAASGGVVAGVGAGAGMTASAIGAAGAAVVLRTGPARKWHHAAKE